jgi:hypothetical protein
MRGQAMGVTAGAGNSPQIAGVAEDDLILGDVWIAHETRFLRGRGCGGDDERERAKENQFHGAVLHALEHGGHGCRIHRSPRRWPGSGRPICVLRIAEFYHLSAMRRIVIRTEGSECFRRRAFGGWKRVRGMPGCEAGRMLVSDLLTVKRWTLAVIWARTPRIALATFLICFLANLIVMPCRADDASSKAARALAQKIAAQIDHKKKVSVEMADLTGEMRAGELDESKKAIESELRTRGVRTVADNLYEVKVRVTLSRDNVERLWIADYDDEGAHVNLIVPFEFPAFDLKSWITGAHLDRELVFSDNSPMLDFACTGAVPGKSCGEVLVLHPDGVVFMSLELNLPRVSVGRDVTWSRDVRGRLKTSGSDAEARIEDVDCHWILLNLHDDAKCIATAAPWTFTGPRGEVASVVLVKGQNSFIWAGANPFFSISGLDVNGEPGWISSGTDSKARIWANKSAETLGTASGWGSELATVKTDCGNGWQILATRQRDHTETDAITVYEWTGTEFRPLSDPVEMNGTIVAMWSAEDGSPARAVVHNLKTGNYEAYLLKVGCSQ